ncbi:hypothetical protein QYF36_004867 [Acer negundo]|nr:hypothetical protein QYF36_004867 [Acer negundo]
MLVSYRRIGRKVGAGPTGKIPNNQSNVGRAGIGSNHGNESPFVGARTSRNGYLVRISKTLLLINIWPTFNKPFKGTVSNGQGHKKDKQYTVNVTSLDMEEEIEDVEVLQSLYKDILQQGNISESICTSSDANHSTLVQVNVADATDFEVVASNLK